VGVDVGFGHGVEFDWHGGRVVGWVVLWVGWWVLLGCGVAVEERLRGNESVGTYLPGLMSCCETVTDYRLAKADTLTGVCKWNGTLSSVDGVGIASPALRGHRHHIWQVQVHVDGIA
jgi:hypothetical protein